jgi:GNAT superfamily N-acetyltransferase
MEKHTHPDVRPIKEEDRLWIEEFYIQRWGSGRVVTRGKLHTVASLPGFIAWKTGVRCGLLTFHAGEDQIEIVSLDSIEPGLGIGTALLSKIRDFARKENSRRIWLITTNDNTPALRFYQKRGFFIVRVHRNAVSESRKIKPEIPLLGVDGIPLRDEIELEIPLT